MMQTNKKRGWVSFDLELIDFIIFNFQIHADRSHRCSYIIEHDHQLLAWATCCELDALVKSNFFLLSEPVSDEIVRFLVDTLLLFELEPVSLLVDWSPLVVAVRFDCLLGVFAGVFLTLAGVFDRLLGDLLLPLLGDFAGVCFERAGDLLLDLDREFDLLADALLPDAILTVLLGVLLVDGVLLAGVLRLDFLAGVLVSNLPKLASFTIVLT